MAVISLSACDAEKQIADYEIIPLPQEVVINDGKNFIITNDTRILFPGENESLERNACFLAGYIKEMTGKELVVSQHTGGDESNAIVLKLDSSIENQEGYELVVNENSISIAGNSPAGVFYGTQTIRKSLPVSTKSPDIVFPAANIKDYPRFKYRGMHLDVSRHFFTTEFVKRYIDILALHNINVFHWHLTDDQGWRIEIKQYPELTEIGSVRKKTVIGKNTGYFEETPYGGFYTQEEVKDIINYAAERYIEIIPEIDLPGHMLAVLAAYPEFGCTGGPYEVEPTWGVFKDVLCIGNEDALKFLENVLDEVSDIFPSKYIHIGGDEAPRDRWKVCPKCQKRIKDEKLKGDSKHTAEDRLQAYCTRRMEEFLNKKGRRIIGWDEILEGEIAPDATVMSWRGMEGGIEAARLGHDVIMVPTSHGYFDYYQTDITDAEPFSIGGHVSVEKVYSLEPIPAVLTKEEAKHILGAQGNLWTEYVTTPEHAEYMILPRIAALSEVQWTLPEKKNCRDFASRLVHLMDIYEKEGYNYATHVFDVNAKLLFDPQNKAVEIVLSTVDDAPVYYTTDGTQPTKNSSKYERPVQIKESAEFNAVAIRPNIPGRVFSKEINFNKATAKPVVLTTPPSARYTFDGAATLVDGLKGGESHISGSWLGFIGKGMEAIIDLEQPAEISRIKTEAIVDVSSWIMGASGLIISVSDDNKDFREITKQDYPTDTELWKKDIRTYEATFEPVVVRYVKIQVKPAGALPKGHDGEGKTPFLFIDEIAID